MCTARREKKEHKAEKPIRCNRQLNQGPLGGKVTFIFLCLDSDRLCKNPYQWRSFCSTTRCIVAYIFCARERFSVVSDQAWSAGCYSVMDYPRFIL